MTKCASAVSCESPGVLVRAEANHNSIGSAENEGQEGAGQPAGKGVFRMVSV